MSALLACFVTPMKLTGAPAVLHRHPHVLASSAAQMQGVVEEESMYAAPSPVQLAFSEAGAREKTSAPPIVILHGLFGAGSNFGSWASALDADCRKSGTPRRIILVDLRNHGASGHSGSMAYADMASDVARLLEEQGIERAVLCGHSVGGKVAMATALLHPERVERLLVLDMAPVAYALAEPQWDSIAQVVSALQAINLDVISSKRDADQMLARTISEPGLRAFVLMNLARTQKGDFRWRVNLDAIATALPGLADWDVDAMGAAAGAEAVPYGGNTLFVGGGKSRFLRSSHLPQIQEQFSRFSLSTIRNADHWVHADEPDALLVIASNFLAASAPP